MTPRVSVCVPNLNMLPFLRERFDTIFGQTLRDWELYVYDGFSDDGAWEFIQQLATQEGRMRVAQGPREGPYAAWNECLRQTKAEFVYIATSDDTMALDCLEKMVGALERHKDCDLALCPLIAIDAAGARVVEPRWPECTPFGSGIEEMLYRPHVHRAPYDGLLHLLGRVVYNSITQLLIRRSLFSRVGYFPTKWGSIGDFNWEMKASLIANTIHVPDTWASWRVHSKQATAALDLLSAGHGERVEEMIRDAFHACEAYLEPAVARGLRSHWLDWTRDMKIYYEGLRSRQGTTLHRRLYQVAQLFGGTAAARSQIVGRLFGRPKWPQIAPTEMRLWLESLGRGPAVTPEA